MGRSVAAVHLLATPTERALSIATEAFRAEGWSIASERGPLAGELAVARVGGWTSVHLPRRWIPAVIDRIVASGDAGILLFTADSDFWGATLFRDGVIVRELDNRKRPPGARLLRKQLAKAFAIDVPEATLAQVLSARPTLAEDAMDAFAKLLSIDSALELPDEGVRRVLLQRPRSSQELEAGRTFDLRAHALVFAPIAGFGAAFTNLVRLAADRVGGGSLGPRNVIVSGTRVTQFEAKDLADVATRLDAGELESVEAGFEALTVTCRRHGSRGRQIQIVVPEAFATDEAAPTADPLGLFTADDELVNNLFVKTSVTFGLIDALSSDPTLAATKLRQLVTWPPVAHWFNYLSPELVTQLGGPDVVHRGASDWTTTTLSNGGISVRMRVPVHRASDPDAQLARRSLETLLAGLAKPHRADRDPDD